MLDAASGTGNAALAAARRFTWSTVWLLDEAQEAEAGAVVNLYRSGAGAETCGAQEWRCPRCCELVEPQFGACWRCGERQPA